MTDLVWVISSCVMILAVIILRAVFGKKLKSGVRMILWALVLLRLLVPGTVFEAPVGVESVAVSVPAVSNIVELRDVSSVSYTENSGTVTYNPVAASDRAVTPARTENNVTPERYAVIKKTLDVKKILTIVWVAGIAVVAGAFLVTNISFYIKIRRRRERIESDCPIAVYTVEGIESPFLLGRSIYVDPETAKDANAMRHVTAHEMSHYRHGDSITTVLRCVAVALHWYNPLVWVAAILSRRDADLFADDGAIKALGEDEREDYGKTLVDLTVAASRAPILNGATMMAGGKRALFERIKRIAKRPKVSIAAILAVVILACAALVFAFTGKADDKKTPDDETENTGEENVTGAWRSAVEVELDDELNKLLKQISENREKGSQAGIDEDGKLVLYKNSSHIYSIHIETASGCFGYSYDIPGGTLFADEIMNTLDNIRVDSAKEITYNPKEGQGSVSVSIVYIDGRKTTVEFPGMNYKKDISLPDSVCFETTGVKDFWRLLNKFKGGNSDPDGVGGLSVNDYFRPEKENFDNSDHCGTVKENCGKWETADRNAPSYDLLKDQIKTGDAAYFENGEGMYIFRASGHAYYVFTSDADPIGVVCAQRIYSSDVIAGIEPGAYYGDIDALYYFTVISPTLCNEGKYSESVAYILTYEGAYRLEFDITGGRNTASLDPLDRLVSVEYFENEYINDILDLPVKGDYAYTKLHLKPSEETRLIIFGEESDAAKYVVMRPEYKDADVPFSVILEELGFRFESDGEASTFVYPDHIGERVLEGIGYLDIDLSDEYFGISPYNDDYCCRKIIDGKIITDARTCASIIYDIGVHLRVDFKNNAVIIY